MDNPFVKIEDRYYVRHSAAVLSGMTDKCLYNRSSRNPEKWGIRPDPIAANRNIYDWAYLKDEDKDLIRQRYSSEPAEYLAMQPIRDMIRKDDKAEAFYMTYSYSLNGEPTGLTPAMVKDYTRNASLLNMLKEVMRDKKLLKKQFGMKLLPWFDQVFAVIQADKYNLPASYANLVSRADSVLKRYEAEGYPALISGKLGKANAAKVKDLAKDMMLELLSHPNQYDDVYITLAYNVWANREGYKEITSATVQNKRIEYGYLIAADREGWQEQNKKFNKSIQRATPSQPGYLWEGDDNHLDWWFADDKLSGVTHRLKCYVVVDSYKGIEYPLGWAFSESDITIETVRLAFLMAIRHIFELTGTWYLPHEIKTDRWGLASLTPFYEGLGHYYPAPIGSKNRGWLENFFGHADWKRSLKMTADGLPATNYTGHNISSKTMGVNIEALSENKRLHQLPKLSEAGAWVAAHFERLRTMPIGFDAKNKSRQQEWLEAWAVLPEEKKRQVTHMQVLAKAGFLHDANGGNEITKNGVQPTIARVKYSYAVPPAFYLQNVGRKVVTFYDPFDMQKVLVTDNEQLRFMANHITPVAGCMQDMQEGGRTFLNQILAEKKADVQTITEAKVQRRQRLAAAGQDAEITLKLGASVRKELKTAATEEWQEPVMLPERTSTQLPFNSSRIEDSDDIESYAAASL